MHTGTESDFEREIENINVSFYDEKNYFLFNVIFDNSTNIRHILVWETCSQNVVILAN